MIFFSDGFATERKEVAEKFMRAWLRGVRSYNDAIKDGKIAGAGAARSLRSWRRVSI